MTPAMRNFKLGMFAPFAEGKFPGARKRNKDPPASAYGTRVLFLSPPSNAERLSQSPQFRNGTPSQLA
jgi:hypothetical protein